MIPLTFRMTTEEDAPHLKEWLLEPGVLRWFPMYDQREVDDAVRIWMGYNRIHSTLTVEYEDKPIGFALLYIQPFKKLAHTCLLSIIVKREFRGKGVGKALLTELIRLAKNKFHIEVLHLEVYEGNPAQHLYEQLGFEEFGFQSRFIKEEEGYLPKRYMQKILV